MPYDDQTNKLLREMHTAIVGNPTLGIPGLVTRMERVEKQVAADATIISLAAPKVEQHEQWILNARIKIAGIAGGAGVISGIVFFLCDYLFKR